MAQIANRLTPRAKRVLEVSAHEAEQLGHKHIGTEHLLLGLLDEPDGIAAQVMAELGVDEAARSKLLETMRSPVYSRPSKQVFRG